MVGSRIDAVDKIGNTLSKVIREMSRRSPHLHKLATIRWTRWNFHPLSRAYVIMGVSPLNLFGRGRWLCCLPLRTSPAQL